MPHPDTPAPHAVDTLPRHTTPTWEVELLISGVAVFAMLKLPGWLGDHLLSLMPRLVSNLGTALLLIYEYLTCAAIILATTFALHLILRAYWIALVGLHSVYPDDILWERLRIGRHLREFLQRHDRGAAGRIERADNRATVIFAVGITLAMIMVALSATALLTFAIITLLVVFGNHRVDAIYVFIIVVVGGSLPLLMAMLVDGLWGSRLRRDGWLQRALVKVYSGYKRVGFLPGVSPQRLLESQVGSYRIQWLIGL
ncbi:MAG: hypothetical protein L0H70_04385, partial [Xanthomonadales bacterium]|nr:hypothetical protein [Xanthomonadales bacterium]